MMMVMTVVSVSVGYRDYRHRHIRYLLDHEPENSLLLIWLATTTPLR